MLDGLQEFTTSLPAAIQWLRGILISAIPFVESYFGAAIGVLAGIDPVVAIAAAIIGNTVSMVAFVWAAHSIRQRIINNKKPQELSPRRERLRAAFNKWGVPGVSLLGQTILPSQITSGAMVSFGASTRSVIVWQVISITLWGIGFGLLAMLGLNLLSQ
ncbi:MAG TPA: hypothetical protein PK890_00655 [Terrimesophilobacter sp.]|nr:hypothetical protein [Terrimesophilobacter sp.]